MADIKRDVEQWINLSDYDHKTAEAMLKSGRYLYVLFCCQQCLEKRLNGLVVHKTRTFPPRTHDLMRLVNLAGVETDEKKEKFLRRITNYYIGTRYPEEVSRLAQEVDKKLAKEYFEKTVEAKKWLDDLMK
jgi:HEPN domain-containing protein